MANVNPIPEGYPRVSPYLSVKGGGRRRSILHRGLGGAEDLVRMAGDPTTPWVTPSSTSATAVIMLSDENPEFGSTRAPETNRPAVRP